MLIVVGGLPATGKSTLSRTLARELGASYVRVDTIEQALVASGLAEHPVGVAGYAVGYAVAEENLRVGRHVVAESVNPLAVTREAWRQVATRTGTDVLEVEVVCSDAAEHRRRAEARRSDVPGLVLPTWQQIEAREYEPWSREHLMVDTAGRSAEDCLADVRRAAGL